MQFPAPKIQLLDLARSLARVLLALALAVAGWEVVLRGWLFQERTTYINPLFGRMAAPFSREVALEEGRTDVRHNELGFWDSPFPPKPPSEIRVLAVGDSFTLGGYMEAAKTYPKQLERRFPANQRVRVMNLGRPGIGVGNHLGCAEAYQSTLEADWVVILLNRQSWRDELGREDFYIEPHGSSFRLTKMFRQVPQRGRSRHLRTVTYARVRLNRRAEDRGGAPPASRLGREAEIVDWSIGRLRALYPRLLLAYLPLPSKEKQSLEAPTSTEAQVTEACRRHGVPLVQLRPHLERAFAETRKPPFGFPNTLPWTGHTNAEGNRVISEAVFASLRTLVSPGTQ